MSLDRCIKCSEIVDTDAEPEFYDFAYRVNDMGGHCSNCRDEIYEKMTQSEQAEHERRTYG